MRYSHTPTKKNISYLLLIILSVVIFLIEFFTVNENSFFTKFYEFQLLAIYGICQIQSVRKFGMFNIFTLILVGFFIFAIGGILHYFLSGDSILELPGSGFGDFYFKNSEIQASLLIYTIFVLLAYLVYKRNYQNNDKTEYLIHYREQNYNPMYFKLGKWLMWSFLIIEIYKGYLYFSSFSLDRTLIYLYGNMANPVPTWVRFLATFYEMGYAFILCSLPDKTIFKKYSALYFVVLIPEILLGNRGMFGAFLLFFFWYYARFYNPQPIKTKYVFIGGALMLVVFQAMQFYRDDSDMSAVTFSLTLFLKGQSVSFFILPLYMQFASSMQYYLYPFVLYNLISGFSGYTGQSIEVLQHNCGVGHQLMYAINPDFYLSGASLGSSSITELYDLGIIGVIVGALFFPVMIVFFEKKFASSRFFLFLSFFLFTSFVMSSRGSFFPNTYAILKYFIFFKMLIYEYQFFKVKKSKI